MENFSLINSIVFAEYLILAAIIIMIVNFLVSLFTLIIRSDVLYNDPGFHFTANVVLIAFEIVFTFFSVIILSTEQLCLILAIPILTCSVIFTFMLIWNFIQLHGISVRSMEILETLVGVIEAGDENLDGHSLHVQNLTMLIYDYLPFWDRQKINPMNLQYASLFLDIGKLGIPREIIDKKGKLTSKEKELIQRHPEICVELFERLPSFTTVTFWVKYHHERVDGNGYYHLKGKEIPLASRILALADTYSAITMDRSYRPSLSHENAITELRLVAGSQLDPNLVELFCSIPRNKVSDCINDVRNRMKKYQSGDFRW